MKNKLVYILALVLAIVGVFIFATIRSSSPSLPINTATSTEETTNNFGEVSPELPDINLNDLGTSLSNDPKDRAWSLFQKYLNFNKNNDLEGVKSVIYRISPICEDTKTKTDCEARMQSAYSYGKVLLKSEFKNIWEDDKQLVLSTDFWTQEDEKVVGRFRGSILFIKNADGTLKLLSFNPRKGALVNAESAPLEELRARVKIYTDDNDLDGISDYDEECLSKIGDDECSKTNPKVRDTDGDGWWDGIEILFSSFRL